MTLFNRKTEKLNTSLYWAIVAGDLSQVKALAELGAEFNVPLTPVTRDEHSLHVAVRHGHLEIADFLLSAGADPLEPFRVGHYEFTLSEGANALGFKELAHILESAEIEATQRGGPRHLRRPACGSPTFEPWHLAP